MTLGAGVLAFFATDLVVVVVVAGLVLGAAFFFANVLGVTRMASSIRRSGFPGNDFVSERVLRVDGRIVAADLVFGFCPYIRMTKSWNVDEEYQTYGIFGLPRC